MGCGTIASLALTATLLGRQELKVERFEDSSPIAACEAEGPSNSNATVKFKDERGRVVFEKKIRIAQTSFYDRADGTGGLHPTKETSFVVTYAMSESVAKAREVSLETHDGSFKRSASLPMRVGLR